MAQGSCLVMVRGRAGGGDLGTFRGAIHIRFPLAGTWQSACSLEEDFKQQVVSVMGLEHLDVCVECLPCAMWTFQGAMASDQRVPTRCHAALHTLVLGS